MHRIDDAWVHRDVSPGNILTDQNTTKLADLEYAKRLNDDKTHDIKTVDS
jgi:serine/threonine protein kinase